MRKADKKEGGVLKIGRRVIPVSSLDKIYYPSCDFSKGEMVDYYIRIAHVMLPHLRRRPVSLKRYPDGVEGKSFFEKNCPSHRPEWVTTYPVSKQDGGEVRYCLFNTLPAIVWAANLGVLEFHSFLHQATVGRRPQFVVLDLDPGPPATIVDCFQVALWIREVLEHLGLRSLVKTSGSKGLQVYIPLNNRGGRYEATKAFAKGIATVLEEAHGALVVSQMSRAARQGKVFIDWSQNDEKKTTICVYSLRARETPTVSTPISWLEVERAWKRREALRFEAREVLARVEAMGDLFAPLLTLRQRLPGKGGG